MKKLMIAVPMMDTVPVEFFIGFEALNKPDNTALMVSRSSLVYNARNWLYNQAKKGGYDTIFWLDSDVVPPSDTIERLAQLMELSGSPMVSGLYISRKEPLFPVIAKELEWDMGSDLKIKHSVKEYKDYPKDGPFQVAGCGMGCCLMKTSLIDEVFEKYEMNPFDPFPFMGEDYSFCVRVNSLGHQIWCDSRIKCGHVGVHVYNEEDYKLQEASYGREV